jgi:hypothetical protein
MLSVGLLNSFASFFQALCTLNHRRRSGGGGKSPNILVRGDGPYNHPPMLMPIPVFLTKLTYFLTILVLKCQFSRASREFVPICIIFYNLSVKIAPFSRAVSQFNLTCEQKLLLQKFFANTIPQCQKEIYATALNHGRFHPLFDNIFFRKPFFLFSKMSRSRWLRF